MFRQDFTCPALLVDFINLNSYGAITHYGTPFQAFLIESIKSLA